MTRTIDLVNCIVYFVYRPIRDIDVELTNYISLFDHFGRNNEHHTTYRDIEIDRATLNQLPVNGDVSN